MAVALARGERYEPHRFTASEAEIEAIVEREIRDVAPPQRYLRGYFTGGTLADEAWIAAHRATGAVHSNNQTDPRFVLADPCVSVGHTVVDLGDDTFTVGRPHPMIDPSARTERMLAERDDGEIAVVVADVVIGHGSHDDPAGALVPAVEAMRAAARRRGGYLPVIVSITGTDADPQNFALQKTKLEAAGCVVMPSNRQACALATRILQTVEARHG